MEYHLFLSDILAALGNADRAAKIAIKYFEEI